jgi:hypothetical protein
MSTALHPTKENLLQHGIEGLLTLLEVSVEILVVSQVILGQMTYTDHVEIIHDSGLSVYFFHPIFVEFVAQVFEFCDVIIREIIPFVINVDQTPSASIRC